MCGGNRWRYWATGVPGWMRGGAGSPRWAHHGYGHELGRAGARPQGFGRCGCESTTEDEVAFLKEEAEGLRHYLEGIERRISELEKIDG